MERRGFLKSLFSVLSLTALASFIYPLFKFLSPRAVSARVKKVTIARKDVPAGGAFKVNVNDTPVIVIHHPNKGYIALSRVCTHLGCLVDYDSATGRIICPCHGANFTVEGKVISGPAPRPLKKMPLLLKGDSILIG